ncbi:hypothetical protein [Salmonella enterica]|uniref:hypothetical protein n=2 Tax=Enterobacteriaceae TaxID=543 RepID=UPI002380E2AA|nr:hypothetical protein [Salmonella enterica]WDX56879.1 hypothetical protein PQQ10_24080 [Salmonella enterica subsp. enterica serovar Dublin]
MSYSVINQDGVHLCDIPLNVYQVIRRQSLSALWLYWAQSLNLVKVLIACVGKMIFVMPVMWFWVLVVCRLVEPERISDVSGLISPDVIGWAAGAAITLIIFSVFTRPALYGYHNFFKQHICSRVKQVTPELRTVTGPLFLPKRNWNDIERNHESN